MNMLTKGASSCDGHSLRWVRRQGKTGSFGKNLLFHRGKKGVAKPMEVRLRAIRLLLTVSFLLLVYLYAFMFPPCTLNKLHTSLLTRFCQLLVFVSLVLVNVIKL